MHQNHLKYCDMFFIVYFVAKYCVSSTKKWIRISKTINVPPKHVHSVKNDLRIIWKFEIIKKSVKNDQYRDTSEN